jgi:hypothetical protein
MNVQEAIKKAEEILPGRPSPDGETDLRWQAIIKVGEFIISNPIDVLNFSIKWGAHRNKDIHSAIATCLIEHLLENHFELVYPKIFESVKSNKHLADTVLQCWDFGQSTKSENSNRFSELISLCKKVIST